MCVGGSGGVACQLGRAECGWGKQRKGVGGGYKGVKKIRGFGSGVLNHLSEFAYGSIIAT